MKITKILIVANNLSKVTIKKDITDIALKSDNIAACIQNQLLKITQLSIDEFFNNSFDYAILINDDNWHDFFKQKYAMPLTDINNLFNENK